jgi:hypothetical protein
VELMEELWWKNWKRHTKIIMNEDSV